MSKVSRPWVSGVCSGAGLCVLAVLTSTASAGGGLELQPKAGDPLNGLTADQLDRFFKGKESFTHPFTAAEGLGPVFNQNSCSSCHVVPIGGSGSVSVTRFGVYDDFTGEFDPLEHLGGSLLQAEVLNGLPPECAEQLPDLPDLHTALRITNSILGAGLVEAIPDADLIANANVSPSGSVHMVELLEDEKSPLRVGRMGWKAQVATVMTFSADAANNEMGISNRLLPVSPMPNGDPDLLILCDPVSDPNDGPDEEGFHFIDRITDFQRFLAPPPQTPKSGMTGEQHFVNIGCADCHVPSWTTSGDPELEDAIRNRTIRPYSDFLLHDMGVLGDGVEQGDAGQREMRTPALWGLRMRDPMLHDGRASGGTFHDRIAGENGVIWWHGQFLSAAEDSADAFFEDLNETQQNELVAFLDSLGRAEFDYTGDNVIDEDDFDVLVGCFTGSGDGSVVPDDPCAIGDVDQDGSVDELDFEYFLLAYEGEQEPCDLWDQLAAGVAPGIDVEIPAECQPKVTCDADFTGDNVVNVSDLLQLLAAWGACPACDEDLNGDDTVNVSDLLQLLSAWGPCDDGSEPKGSSCAGFCGGQAPDGCWCDDQCVGFGDCCPDACELCDECAPVESCKGFCGGQSDDGCWCDDQCAGFGDCCADVCEQCPDLPQC